MESKRVNIKRKQHFTSLFWHSNIYSFKKKIWKSKEKHTPHFFFYFRTKSALEMKTANVLRCNLWVRTFFYKAVTSYDQ